MAPLCSRTGLVGPVPKGRRRLSWMNRRYKRNLDSFIWTNIEMPIKWMEASRLFSSKESRPTQCTVKVMFIEVYDIDRVIMHHALLPRQMVNAAYYSRSCCTTFVQRSGENGETWWHRTSSFFMTMRGVTPLLLSQTSCAVGSGRFWNIHRSHSIWVHAIMISSSKWKNHCESQVQHKSWTYPWYRAVSTEHKQRWCTTPSKHLAKGDK